VAFSRSLLFGSSLLLHAGLAVGVRSLPPPARSTDVAIVVTESKPAPKVPPPPAPPPKAAPKPAPPAAKAPKAAPAPAPEPAPAPAPAPVAAAGDGPGLPVGPGGDGTGNGTGKGIGGNAATPAPSAARPAAAPPPQDTCAEPMVKPKAIAVVEPAYTESARAAGLQGRVRVEITVGPDGRVTNARVLQGLGQGLDEAAIAAARASTFSAATRCGRAVPATFTIGMRFSL
jgi:protein TonB